MASPAKRRWPSCIPGLVLRAFGEDAHRGGVLTQWEIVMASSDKAKLVDLRVTEGVVAADCHDGQRTAWTPDDRIAPHRCRHVVTALRSAVDPDGEAANARVLDAVARADTETRARQERELPGERARVEHALKHFSPAEVVKAISRRLQTFEGLALAAELFADLPPPRVRLRCLRCENKYDPALRGDDGKPCKDPGSN
ncbi:hypothetical protein M885DRAFT_611406 [Pelagophyceae sp. CCMP2097]|nr:hypothetical protein M885DRAFT_611406 [Pelagophyceae sp. CCMP2097]